MVRKKRYLIIFKADNEEGTETQFVKVVTEQSYQSAKMRILGDYTRVSIASSRCLDDGKEEQLDEYETETNKHQPRD
jgi:hypothetical protein